MGAMGAPGPAGAAGRPVSIPNSLKIILPKCSFKEINIFLGILAIISKQLCLVFLPFFQEYSPQMFLCRKKYSLS